MNKSVFWWLMEHFLNSSGRWGPARCSHSQTHLCSDPCDGSALICSQQTHLHIKDENSSAQQHSDQRSPAAAMANFLSDALGNDGIAKIAGEKVGESDQFDLQHSLLTLFSCKKNLVGAQTAHCCCTTNQMSWTFHSSDVHLPFYFLNV